MSSRLADRLITLRQRQFVGRAGEVALLEAALTAPELPFSVLYVYGPGGVGKTTLLHRFARLATQHNLPAWYIDAHAIEPTPEGFLAALQSRMRLDPSISPLVLLSGRPSRRLLLLDTCEALALLDPWLQDHFLPQLDAAVLVVCASRNPPSLRWFSDSGWRMLFHPLPLGNLNLEESSAYLAGRQVPVVQHQAVLAFTRGHPLALSLVADLFAQWPDLHFTPEAAPDVIKTLLEQFVQKVPSPAHYTALEVCALARYTTEALLAWVAAQNESRELFDWLRGLSCIESGPQGLFPHDLARETLTADIRWRNPERYADLCRRIGAYHTHQVRQLQGQAQQCAFFDYLFLFRTHPLIRHWYDALNNDLSQLECSKEYTWSALMAMLPQHDGPSVMSPAEWLDWFAEQGSAPELPQIAPAQEVLQITRFSRAAFEDAVRAALYNLHQPLGLRDNPLLQSRMVLERAGLHAGENERVKIVQELLRAACEALHASPREAHIYRVLHHTYLQPAPTHMQAAQVLDLPYGTFRRHLKAGFKRVVDLLWEWEMQGVG